ncbi:response regulator [Omnitrophica bacterium]|nr:response regulator [Candidatus Omnitrophota bacterium]
MSHKVLVVDDNEDLLDVLSTTLSLAGYEVHTAASGDQFRSKITQLKPDMILLDILLGEENGVEIYEKMLSCGFSSRIPVVFISALAKDRPPTPPSPDRRYSLIGKPFSPEALVEQLKVLLAA